MTYGFSESVFEKITVPDTEFLLVDDCTLAFFLGFRNKTLWHLIHNKQNNYEVFHIPKSNGKRRVIHAPSALMKAFLHSAHARLLLPMQEGLGDHVTAYRPNRSIVHAVARHIPKCDICDSMPKGRVATKHKCPRQGAYIRMDLKDFFPSTRRAWIRHLFQDAGYSFHVSGILANLMTVGFVNPRGVLGEKYVGTPKQKFYHGVPQGAPTSGAICNLVADARIDRPILQYFAKKNTESQLEDPWDWRYSRYADDLTITCGEDISLDEKKQVVRDIAKIIETARYKVNKSKTKITSAFYRRKMLGVVMNQKLNIAYDDYLHIRAVIHNCMVNGVETQYLRAGKESPEKLIQYLRGKVSFISNVHPGKGERLKSELDVAIQSWRDRNEPTQP